MKVSELIEKLQKMPQDAPVYAYSEVYEGYSFNKVGVTHLKKGDDAPYAQWDYPDDFKDGMASCDVVIIGDN